MVFMGRDRDILTLPRTVRIPMTQTEIPPLIMISVILSYIDVTVENTCARVDWSL